jgi:putative membrane protein (TIGR04086 family)
VNDLDLRAVLAGALAGAAVIVPALLLSIAIADDDASTTSAPAFYFFALFGGFALAGYVAARRERGGEGVRPVQHGTVAAIAVYVAIQIVGIVRVLGRGESVRPIQIIANLLLAAACGSVGGLLSTRAAARAGGKGTA